MSASTSTAIAALNDMLRTTFLTRRAKARA